MKELATRAISGTVFVALLIAALYTPYSLLAVLLLFGILSLIEFSKLTKLKSFAQYAIFILIFGILWYFNIYKNSGSQQITQVILVVTIFVNLILIKDLFTEKQIPLFKYKRFILSTFYVSAGFIFMLLIANFNNEFTPQFLLGAFILIWVNDSFAYLVGKNFGKQKLFPSISPKKTVEGFLGGLLFACISSYFIAQYFTDLNSTNWLIIAIIVSVFGTLGDLIESKFKRQAQVKDSGIIMPGHGGLLDRLDSIIFAAPFIYLFLRIIYYVS